MPASVATKKRRAAVKTAAAPREPEPAREARAPIHARGQRRVDAILDAASLILAEEGAEGLTIESIAKRSDTSKSSMYHFFRDLDCVIGSLAQRHICQFVRVEEEMLSATIDWAALHPDEMVDRYLAPITQYLADHPDMLVVMQLGGPLVEAHASDVKKLHLTRAERILQARYSGVRPAERTARAAVMVGSVVGSMQIAALLPHDTRTPVLRELHNSLVAYITDLDARSARR